MVVAIVVVIEVLLWVHSKICQVMGLQFAQVAVVVIVVAKLD